MSLAVDKALTPAVRLPAGAPIEEPGLRLNITVIFTSVEATLAALKEAAALASSLGARITLVVPQIVPYRLPLESPPVLLDFNENRFRVLASRSQVETSVSIYLCRDRFEMLTNTIREGTIVFVGGRKRWWWPTGEEMLARNLSRLGYEVIFKDVEAHQRMRRRGA